MIPAVSSRYPKRSRGLRASRRPRLRLSPEQVEELVEQALDELPEDLLERLDNVFVTVEEEPSPEDLASVGMDPERDGDDLFGLYLGVPLSERDSFYDALPDRVVVYSGPILRAVGSRREAIDEIKKTVIHELGHHFGLDDDEMPY